MADFKLKGSTDATVDSLGVITQGIGFPLRDVEDDTTPAVVQGAYATVYLTKSSFLRPGRYLKIGDVDVGTTPMVADEDTELLRVIVARSDVDQAEIEVLIDDVVRITISSINKITITNVPIPVQAGQQLSVRCKEGSNTMQNVVIQLIFRI